MYLLLTLTLSILFLNIVRIESYSCSCSCCFGQGCQATQLPSLVDAAQCNDASCLAACKARYYQCTSSPPYGQAIGKCLTTTTSTTTNSPGVGGPYSCQCNCCNTGSYTCTPTLIGYTNAFSCQVGSCSIACTKQYPYVCVNTQFGQTQGTCVGISGSTPSPPTGTTGCSCSCCGSSGCHNYQVTTTNGCSSCSTACQSLTSLQCSTFQVNSCTN